MAWRLRSLSTRARGLLAIVGGSAGAQLVGLASAPVISRLYSPHEYGIFAVVNAVLLPLATVTALRLDFAVPLPDDPREALRVARLGLRATVWLGGVFMLATLLGHHSIARLLKIDASLVLLWAPVVASLLAAFTVLNQVAIRERMYAAIGVRNLLQGSVVAVCQVLAGLMHAGAHGLAAGLALGQLVGVLSLAWVLRGLPWRDRAHEPWLSVLRRYRRYPLIMAPSGLANTLGLQVPVLVTAALYGGQVSGWIGMTQRVLALPVTLLGVALSQVFLGEFGAAKRSSGGSLEPLFIRTSRRLALIGAVVAAVVLALGPVAFGSVLGSAWETSGRYAQALAVALALQMVASPLSQTLIVLGRLSWQAWWDLGRLVACGAAVLVAHAAGCSALGAVWGLGVAQALAYAVSWWTAWRALRAHTRGTSPASSPRPPDSAVSSAADGNSA